MLKFFGWLLDRLFVVLGALLGSQIPEFMQQYTQRLGGHVDELSHLLALIKQSAALSQKSLDVYIQKFMTNTDPDFVLQGQFMKSIVSRWEQLSADLHNILESTMWTKPFVFFSHIDTEVFSSTMKSFKPGFALTIEGVVYTALGIFIVYSLYYGFLKLCKGVFASLRSKKTVNIVH